MLLRDDDGLVENLDEMVNEEAAAAEKEIEELCSGASCQSVPATNLLQIKVVYLCNKIVTNIMPKDCI